MKAWSHTGPGADKSEEPWISSREHVVNPDPVDRNLNEDLLPSFLPSSEPPCPDYVLITTRVTSQFLIK